jgi:hypothetical protein
MNGENFTFLLDITRRRITEDVMKSIDIAMVLEPYTDSLKELIKLNNGKEKCVVNTMLHDFIGLSSNDEHFVPRLKLNNSLN